MSLAVVPIAVAQLFAQLLKGLKRILFSQISLAILPAAAIPAVVILARRGVAAAAAAYALAALLGVAGSILFWRRNFGPDLRGGGNPVGAKELMQAAYPLLVVATLNLVMQWSAPLLIGVWRPAAEVAVFNVAHRTAFLTTLMLTAVNSIAAPKFAELYQSRDMEALGRTARDTAKMMTVAAVPPLLLFVVAPEWVMSLFGPGFAGGGSVLAILAVGQFVNVATGSVGFVLIMTGRERLARNNAAAAAVLNLLLLVLLVPAFGPIGAAVATSMSVATLNLTAAYLVRRSLGIRTLPLRIRK
jgi:O-antigen/teichoic acid export membrane protein